MTPPREVVLYSDSLSVAGAEEVFVNLATHADGQRWGVRAALPRSPTMERLGVRLRAAAVEVDEVPAAEDLPWPRRVGAFLKYVRRRRPALLYVNRPRLPDRSTAAVIAARLAGVPVILHDHWGIPRIWEEGPAARHRSGRVSRALRARAPAAAARWIIFPCEATRAVAVSTWGYPAGRTRVVYNGIDVDGVAQAAADRLAARRALGLDDDAPVALAVARLAREKGHRYLIEAMAAVAARFPRGRLLLAGDGPQREEIEELIRSLGLAGHVALLGWRQDITRLLGACDVFVLPSLSECLPLVVLEAMAVGRPVVATTVAGIPEMVVDGETGLLVPPRDAAALGQALTRLLASADDRQAMGAAGHARAAGRFGLSRMLTEIYALWEMAAPSPLERVVLKRSGPWRA